MALESDPGFLIYKGDTPANIARRRAVADAMMARSSSPKNVGEGLSAIGNALIVRGMNKRADAADAAGNASAQNAWQMLAGGVGHDPSPFATPATSAPMDLAPPGTPAPASTASAAPAPGGGDYYTRMAMIESGGNPNDVNPKTGAAGLYQFMPATAKAYGLTDPKDPIAAKAAVERFTEDNRAALRVKLGREPTDGELYLAHQQGAGGASALLANPNLPAVDALAPAYKGNRAIALRAITNNGGTPDMTAGQFAQKWVGRFGSVSAPQGAPVLASPLKGIPAVAAALAARQAGGPAQPVQVASTDPRIGMMPQGPLPPSVPMQNGAPPQAASNTPLNTGFPDVDKYTNEMTPGASDGFHRPEDVPLNTGSAWGAEGGPPAALPAPVIPSPGPSMPVAAAPPAGPSTPSFSPGVATVAAAMPPQGLGAPPVAPAVGFSPGVQRVAQAMQPPVPPQPAPPQPAGPSTQALMAVLSHPFASPGQKAYAQAMLDQRMKQSDPSYALEMKYKQAQLDNIGTTDETRNWKFAQDHPGFNPAKVRPLTDPAERSTHGIPETDHGPYQINVDGTVTPVRSSTGGFGGSPDPDQVLNIADSIERGDTPPTEISKNSRFNAPVIAELAKRGVPLSKMVTDWTATQRWATSMNSTQQVRLRQNITTVKGTLGTIRSLAEEWKAGGFPLLNAATRQAALQGVLGPEANRIATLLGAQIADVTGEMGSVLMGGNSPTDHAMDLAAKNLSADWSYPTLIAALDQFDKNITFREGAINSARPAGVNDGQYAPPPIAADHGAAPGGPAMAPAGPSGVMTSSAGATPAGPTGAAPAAAAPVLIRNGRSYTPAPKGTVSITGKDDAEVTAKANALPPGTKFVGPDGKLRTVQPSAAAAASGAPAGVDANTWKYMTPEERALWPK